MKILAKNILFCIGIIIAASVLFSFLGDESKASKEVSLGELAKKIEAGEIVSMTVNRNDIIAELKDKTTITAKKELEAGLTETLTRLGVSSQALQNIAFSVSEDRTTELWAGILLPTLLPIALVGLLIWFMFRQARSGANQAMNFGRSNLKLFTAFKDKVSFKDVAGLKEAKNELEEVVDFLKNPQKFLDLGAKIPRGVLLMGPPGTGKTLLARAVAGEGGVPFFHISASEFVEMFVGVGASRTRDAFQTAKKAAPAILFIDEIDAIGRERGAGLGGGHDEREQTLNQILVEMDGFDNATRLIVLAATNRPDVLDAALLRPGRFDRRVVLDLPDKKDRTEILKIHSVGKPLEADVDVSKVAARTPGFSGADLANIMNEAAIFAARSDRKLVSQQDLYDSIEKVLLGPARKGAVISDKERSMIAYHEAGHALVASAVPNSDPVHKVSIVSRGRAGGYTIKLPLEEMHLKTRAQFVADLAVSMGGYASEELTFGDVSTGASNDLKEASGLARRLVTKYGMSALGPITFGKSEEMIFLGREIATEKDYSESVATSIDGEVKKFMTEAYETAKEVLKKHNTALDAIAKVLLEKETLEQDEFEAIIKPFQLKSIAIA